MINEIFTCFILQVVCGKCSGHKVPLQFEENKMCRVCQSCHKVLIQRSAPNSPEISAGNSSAAFSRGKGVLEVCNIIYYNLILFKQIISIKLKQNFGYCLLTRCELLIYLDDCNSVLTILVCLGSSKCSLRFKWVHAVKDLEVMGIPMVCSAFRLCVVFLQITHRQEGYNSYSCSWFCCFFGMYFIFELLQSKFSLDHLLK